MDIYKTITDTQKRLDDCRSKGLSIGFVPTMGALHQGHLELVSHCKNENDIAVCSIFVNPLQFNVRSDFEHYPQTPGKDFAMLEVNGCDLLFYPDESEMYPEDVTAKYDFGKLEQFMEGRFRPGHFNGVAVVVKRLFDIINPRRAYFGEKDYQQLLVIKRLVEIHKLPVEIVPCPTVRESDGLAMSSRNMRLSDHERKIAPAIYEILKESVIKAKVTELGDVKEFAVRKFRDINEFKLEYYEISDAATLEPVINWEKGKELIACVAVYIGNVRLIDNIRFIL